MTRKVGLSAFDAAAIEEADLSETVAESAIFVDMVFLERLILPRCCALDDLWGVPALRSLAFGRARNGAFICLGSNIDEVRFESLFAPRRTTTGLESARVHGEVPPSSRASRTRATSRELGWLGGANAAFLPELI
jgi:hypothetical protein